MPQAAKTKILLLGKKGMLGSAIKQHYELGIRNYEFISWDSNDLDITKRTQVFKKLSKLLPDIVINATGFTDVDSAESNSQTAFKVNGYGVGYLAQVCQQVGASLIHFSTDYVFDGTLKRGYCEDDIEHLKPVNIYGESKLKGEIEIQKLGNSEIACPLNWRGKLGIKFFIIRTSWLYGKNGKNFVDTMIKRYLEGHKEFKVVDDQFGKPTYAGDLAQRVIWMIQQRGKLASGIYHCTNKIKLKVKSQKVNLQGKSQKFIENIIKINSITWYEFAREIFRQAKKLKIISAIPKIEPCSSTEFPRPALRPKYSVLINTKLPSLRIWQLALKDYLREKYFYAKNI